MHAEHMIPDEKSFAAARRQIALEPLREKLLRSNIKKGLIMEQGRDWMGCCESHGVADKIPERPSFR